MNKFIATSAAFLIASSLAVPAFADSNSSSSMSSSSSSSSVAADTKVASSADLLCMGNAVDAREGAVLTARSSLDTKITAALTTRRASLKTAYTIANNADRKVAIKAALTVFAKASADAHAQYRTDIKAAWATFNAAIKACNLSAGTRVKAQTKTDHDNGRHLGQLKKQIKNAFDVNANGKLDLDLGL